MTPDQLKALMHWVIKLNLTVVDGDAALVVLEAQAREKLYAAFGFTVGADGDPVGSPGSPAQPDLFLTGGDGRTHLVWSCPCSSCVAWRNTSGRKPPG